MTAPPLEILYEDNHLLVVRKPAGRLVQGDRTGDPTLFEDAKRYLKEKYRKPGEVYLGIVHRLDRPVSGVLVFARTSKAAAHLSEQFRTREVRKVYWAVVEGTPDPKEGRLEDWIGKNHGKSFVREEESAETQHAALRYRVLETDPKRGRSLLEIELETGRHHQIRVQLASRGCAIVGDVKYGARGPLPGGELALFARLLTICHPTKGEPVTFTAEPPDSWPWERRA